MINNRNFDYLSHLYNDGLEGYIQVIQLKNKDIIDIKNYKNIMMKNIKKAYAKKSDVFITPNSSFNGRRSSKNIRQLRALYIDIDSKETNISELMYMIYNLVNDNETKKANRRNENGLTSREQQKEDLIKRINKLIIKGLTNKQIAKILEISVRQIQRYKKIL